MLEYMELPIYPPYKENGLIMLPLNHSVVLGPHEVRGINLPIKFPSNALQGCLVALPNRKVTLLVKTDGVRIWGALKNYSHEPQ